MKLNDLIQEEINSFLKESPDNIKDDKGNYVDYRDAGTYPFALNSYTSEVFVGNEREGHGDDPKNIGNGNMEYLRNKPFKYQGRIFSNQKVVTFWDYAQKDEIFEILNQLKTKTGFNFWDGTWKIEVYEYNPEKERNTFKLVPIEQYVDSENIVGGDRDAHLLSPLQKKQVAVPTGVGSRRYGEKMPIKYKQALRQESENIFEQVEKILKEWDDGDDWLYNLYEERDNIMRDTIVDFMSKPPTARQPWKVVPFGRLRKIWEDAAKMGIVRDTQGLQEIQERMVRNLLKLDVNTELLGHMEAYPDESMFEDAGTTQEDFREKLDDWSNIYFDSPNGQSRISDYGLKPLWKYAEQLIKENDPIKKIQYVDQMLNIVHARSDMAENFIEGGSASLTQLFDGEREWEVHRPL